MKPIQIKFTNGWFAEYAGDGKWVVIDNTEEQEVRGCSYLDSLVKKFGLKRISN